MADPLAPGDPLDFATVAEEIRSLYALNPAQGEALLEGFLEERFKDLGPEERVRALSRLARRFAPSRGPSAPGPCSLEKEAALLSRLFSLILGEAVSPDDLASEDVLDRLAASLNIVFDSLNRLVAVIDSVLYGGSVGLSSIRHIIGSHVQGDEDAVPLEDFIERIKTAFLDSQRSFQAAAEAEVAKLLSELDPERIAQVGGGVKFGPFQKAEMFKHYEERFGKCRKWFESGRFKLELQKAFEKNCEALSKRQGGKL
jgi:hypothetical protein